MRRRGFGHCVPRMIDSLKRDTRKGRGNLIFLLDAQERRQIAAVASLPRDDDLGVRRDKVVVGRD